MNGATLRLGAGAAWVPLAVAGAAIVGTYAPVIAEMADEWARFPNLSHGFAIPAIAAYLVWARRENLLSAPTSSVLAGLPVLALAILMLLTGSLGGESFIARLSLPVALLGATLFLGGAAVTRQLWMGIAYLLFMIPLPFVMLKSLTYQSRLFDAAVTAEIVQWLGVPVLRDGVMLYLANITLEVADECSSIPAMAALVALGAAYAQMNPRPTWIRVALVVSAIPLGLMSNIVRIVLTAVSAYYFGRIALDNVIHKFNGTTVFLLTVFLLIALDAGLLAIARRIGRAPRATAGREA
ncbi:MAG TPA: exosortase [Candidatus Limnocylindrales bacterium]|nr:exosortase [Candidatus Limnocylindrales bacterium]